MVSRYMQTIYLGESGDGLHTGVGAEFKSDEATTAAFESAKQYAISVDEAAFLLDLHEDNGDIVDTIGISAESYELITGEKVLSLADYQSIDDKYWAEARANYKAA